MEYTAGMVCPVCESAGLEENSSDMEFEYKGKKVVVSNISQFDCPVCKESFINRKDRRVLERLLTDERRKVDGLLTSAEIKAIRKIFNVTQVQFAKALRVGEKNFARYESGQSAQSYAMDGLLRVLREFPEAFKMFDKDWSDVGERKIIQVETSYRKKRAQRARKKVELSNLKYTLNRKIA